LIGINGFGGGGVPLVPASSIVVARLDRAIQYAAASRL